MSLPEVILWDGPRKGSLGALRFRRQHPMGAYILDFYCPSARLAVEIDGQGHGHPDQMAHDNARDRWLKSKGLRVLRVPAASILDEESLTDILVDIEAAAAPSTPSGSPSPASGGGL